MKLSLWSLTGFDAVVMGGLWRKECREEVQVKRRCCEEESPCRHPSLRSRHLCSVVGKKAMPTTLLAAVWALQPGPAPVYTTKARQRWLPNTFTSADNGAGHRRVKSDAACETALAKTREAELHLL